MLKMFTNDNFSHPSMILRALLLYVLLAISFILLKYHIITNKKKFKKQARKIEEAPGPKPWPIIGSLHLLAAAQLKGMIPYAAFTALKKVYGDVFAITLGTTKCIVVNDEKSVREVLISKDSDFDGRPDFKRFDILFGGDKQNCKYFQINWFCRDK